MNIDTVKIQGSGYLVNGIISVPRDTGNRHYKVLQEWIAQGNTPEPEFTAKEVQDRAIAIEEGVAVAREQEAIKEMLAWVASLPSCPQSLKDKAEEARVIREKKV